MPAITASSRCASCGRTPGCGPAGLGYKIYYIDEVHMLSTGAFNALLKTLEEPPPHVKFFFATTEANKIPITVLSRCQRYDFAGITPEVIAATLDEICRQEQVEAEPEALQVVARRAGGSLRDAQSLLDRLLASGSPRLTVEVVNGLLGTASDERLLAMIEALADHDAAAALRLLEQSAGEGVQPAELLSGLIDFMRDALVLAVGAESMLLSVSPRQRPRVEAHRRSAGRSTRFWRRYRSSRSAGPGCEAVCTAGCWSSWRWSGCAARRPDRAGYAGRAARRARVGVGPAARKPDLAAARQNPGRAGSHLLCRPNRPPPPVKPPENSAPDRVVRYDPRGLMSRQ